VKLAQEEGNRVREQVILPHNEKVSAGENFKAALKKFGTVSFSSCRTFAACS
jgi:hypothetical protein